jgi:regulator of sigma E protease
VEVELQFERDADLVSFRMPFMELDNRFNPLRGIYFQTAREIRKAGSWKAAWALGLRETKQGVEQVFFVLRNIGSLFKNLGGPIMIATAGTQEASLGIPRLLLFLSLLSANLAVLNMLPIPVLDGGHMMFLLYEGIVGKPVNERITIGLTMLGLFFILGLMVFVFSMDIYRLITW